MQESTSILRAKHATKCINDIKAQNSTFKAKELAHAMKMLECPYSAFIFTILKNTKLLKKVEKARYKFAFEGPVYFGAIQKELDKVANNQKNYTKVYLSKNKQTVISEKITTISEQEVNKSFTIEEAINLLKVNGYKIQKPTMVYEEC